MTLRRARLVAGALTCIATYVGGWATWAPGTFFTHFPGGGRAWVVTDGPFNEHLVRDVGAFYLALAAAGVLALRDSRARQRRGPGHAGLRVVGVAWTAFGALHVGYHAGHAAELDGADRIGNVASLALMVVLSALLLVPVAEVQR